jgi:2-(1,2-epoxy-1,2-dihydrophenyl)acetyl-CoA isomerase
MIEYDTLTFEQTAARVRITLNRPAAANGMNDALARELADAAARCDSAETKVVILTGGSGRFFSGGGDLKAMAAAPMGASRYAEQIALDLHRAISKFAHMQAILITAINGVAAGGGFSLALIGDLVVAAESASFVSAYTKAGLSPDGSSSYYLPRLVGIRRAQQLMLTNQTLSASVALRWGLVSEVVADHELSARADELANAIVSLPKASNAAVKKLLLNTFTDSLEGQMALETRLIAACAETDDGREGIEAFLQKRPANFA